MVIYYKDKPVVDLASFVKRLAKNQKINLADIAFSMDVSPQYLSQVLSGSKHLNDDMLNRIANVLKVNKEELFIMKTFQAASNGSITIDTCGLDLESTQFLVKLRDCIDVIPHSSMMKLYKEMSKL